MRCLELNKVTIYYALYQGETPILDNEYNTGEMKVSFSDPVPFRANVSPATGNTYVEQFGNSVQYDKVIVTDDIHCPIDEHSVLCVDHAPSYDVDGNLIFDYVVKKVARSLNSVSIAIGKVGVS